ncbi:MAG: hypothetical protein NZ740_06555 [Kiritimatiellae bacterium]|nr:hypothetical protein [Kiritimatiellia bacterium]MDW8458757.1 hypothetical protein [Verrucomicrobiota bacterium]
MSEFRQIECEFFEGNDYPLTAWMDAGTIRRAEPLALIQAWRSEPEADWRPGKVRLAWCLSGLLVWADLEDDDLVIRENRFNAMIFHSTDVFEIFIRPSNQDAYYEFHVSPANQRMQLRIPSAEKFAQVRRQGIIPPDWLVRELRFDSRVWADPRSRRWRIGALIPFSGVEEVGPTPNWLVSFARYDYSRHRGQPVLSSTSSHPVVDFHRQTEWLRLIFRGRES